MTDRYSSFEAFVLEGLEMAERRGFDAPIGILVAGIFGLAAVTNLTILHRRKDRVFIIRDAGNLFRPRYERIPADPVPGSTARREAVDRLLLEFVEFLGNRP